MIIGKKNIGIGKKLGVLALFFAVSVFSLHCDIGSEGGADNESSGEQSSAGEQEGETDSITENVSTAASTSHNSGTDCMSCHSVAGGKSPYWTVAGTLYSASGTMTVAAAGSTITSVGGATLTVDSSGNFYTTGILDLSTSQPSSTNSGKTMGRKLGASDGSCNQSGCHEPAGQGVLY